MHHTPDIKIQIVMNISENEHEGEFYHQKHIFQMFMVRLK